MAGRRKGKPDDRALMALEPPPRTSRARASVPGPESTVAERVAHIAHLMVTGRYAAYATRVELSAAWGVTDSTIRNYSAEAHHLVEFDAEERDRMRTALASTCRGIRTRAGKLLSNVTGLPDFGSMIRAIELEAKFVGIELDTKKVEVSGAGGAQLVIQVVGEAARAFESPDEPKPEQTEPDGSRSDPASRRD